MESRKRKQELIRRRVDRHRKVRRQIDDEKSLDTAASSSSSHSSHKMSRQRNKTRQKTLEKNNNKFTVNKRYIPRKNKLLNSPKQQQIASSECEEILKNKTSTSEETCQNDTNLSTTQNILSENKNSTYSSALNLFLSVTTKIHSQLNKALLPNQFDEDEESNNCSNIDAMKVEIYYFNSAYNTVKQFWQITVQRKILNQL
ncbi:uncharacterized protein LOC109860204 isoform X2 [Pseudomyrmex gracilis]|uniref:uncharacterized protein LOC109860204 isoform X2 n=1 Tax=Pseudomyrmex gracilis TaxID=219809 RepID=UPI0009958662|nr:uncharacterized protein LOC109860204 isoform X2 [Pseudomyrmex gracilis]